MNSTVYLFGNIKGVYSQYPNDYSTSILTEIGDNSKSETQLCVHRDDDLMYYCYVRTLPESQYIGACILLNGVMFNDISSVFRTFEEYIATLVKSEKIIKYNSDANIVPCIEEFSDCKEINDALTILKKYLDSLASKLCNLPPKSFSIANDENIKYFVDETDTETMFKSSYTYPFSYFKKRNGFTTPEMAEDISVIKQKNEEIRKLKEELQFSKATIEVQRNRLINQQANSRLAYPNQVQEYRPNTSSSGSSCSGCIGWVALVLLILTMLLIIGGSSIR